MKPLGLALLVSLYAVTGAAAQTVSQRSWDDFTRLAMPGTVIVVDDSGVETKGRLLRVKPDELTMTVDGKEKTFAPSHVAAVFKPGDSLKNGMVIGFLVFGAMGAVSGAVVACDDDYWGSNPTNLTPCTGSEIAGLATFVGMVSGAYGIGIGALVDKLTPGRRRLYERPRAASSSMGVTPLLSPSRAGLSMRVSW